MGEVLSLYRKTLDESPLVGKIRRFFESDLYLALLAAATVFSYALQLEVVLWYLVVLVGCFSLVISKDLSPALPITFLAPFFVSVGNSPGRLRYSGSLFEGWSLLLIGVLIGIIITSFIFRMALWGVCAAKPVPKRSRLLLPSLFLLIGLLLNGLGSETHGMRDMLFGLLTAACWLGFFFIYYYNAPRGKGAIDYFCRCCFWVAVALLGEFLWLWGSQNAFVNGQLDSTRFFFGWGIHNNYGCMMCMLLGPIFYLAATKKKHWRYYFVALAGWVAVALTNSRSTLAVSTLLVGVCSILLCFLGKHKRRYRRALQVLIILVCLFLILMGDSLSRLLPRLFDADLGDNGRFKLWRGGVRNFLNAPLFGVGFYAIDFKSFFSGGYPGFLHNTVLELMAAGGVVLIAVYLYYRYHTLKILCRRMTLERLFLGLSIGALLLASMIDNHVFNIYPCFYYAVALALAEHDLNDTLEGNGEPLKKKPLRIPNWVRRLIEKLRIKEEE